MIILRLWAKQPGRVFCISTKSGSGKWKDHFFEKDEFSKIRSFLKDHDEDDIYFCPHGFKSRVRQKEEAVAPLLCWADLDEVDPKTLGKLKPTIAIQSSPGRYVGLWMTDRPIPETLNRRLTYAIEADRGGWDFSQVLRFPGTKNFKYDSQPRVRVLWDDGPAYTVARLDKALPDEDAETSDVEGVADAKTIYMKYERALPHWVRRELFAGKPRPGQRSEMLWKLEHAIIDAGCSAEEAFVLLKASPWNKFRGRQNEDRQLRREIEKTVTAKFQANEDKVRRKPTARRDVEIAKKGDEDETGFNIITLANVEEEAIHWIWKPYLALGELTILEGDPDLGKSYLAQMIGGAIVDGRRLPTDRPTGLKPTAGPVIYFDLENSAASIMKPRLVDNSVKRLDRFLQVDNFFTVDDDGALDDLYELIGKIKPKLVVFDTINTYIGKADTHKSSEVQQAFAHFREIAREFQCAVLVLRHLTKSKGGEKALYRGQGSIAFTGLARVVMTCGTHPEEPDWRVMAVTKCNIAKKPKALTYRIRGLKHDRSRFMFGEFVDLSSDEILAVSSKASDKAKDEAAGVKDASDFLRDVLDDGPLELAKLRKMVTKRGLSWRHVMKAKEQVGIELGHVGKTKQATWELSGSGSDKDREE
jgi:hypothetical protein